VSLLIPLSGTQFLSLEVQGLCGLTNIQTYAEVGTE
jgi:hypothetical protein